MEFRGVVRGSFSASHVVKDHPLCGRLHGHRWRVQVEIKAGPDPETGDLAGLPELEAAVVQFCAEVDREHLNDFFPASRPTQVGIGLALRERLILDWPNISSIQVWADDIGVTIR